MSTSVSICSAYKGTRDNETSEKGHENKVMIMMNDGQTRQ